MRLTGAINILVGVLTGLVSIFPIAILLLVFAIGRGLLDVAVPPFPFGYCIALEQILPPSVMCVIQVLLYALMVFYIAHAVRNSAASDSVRTPLILLVVFIPFLGMPAYYAVFLLPPTPPAWALKPKPPER